MTRSNYFNSRPCGRGDTGARMHNCANRLFQFTPLREGRQSQKVLIDNGKFNFNSRPCGRGDPFRRHLFTVRLISIHAPAGGATRSFFNRPDRDYFNSRPCGRGDTLPTRKESVMYISIHAPAGGATCRPSTRFSVKLFQFTPLREGRRNRKR